MHKATQLTLTYREMANDFREEVRQDTKARNPTSHRIIKGSFSPSFAGTKGAKEAYPGDALDSEDGSEPAPDGFMERENIRIKANEALLDPELQEELERLKHQKGESQS
ncbi:hypothetical protein B0H67DRAFT_551256 [Lasiosphaeris hirsuta]|uniref:Uncharacterized protein n=1 Tax=Lasiosphaeris hirsuta TaxID=260670 RepID=A0AA40B163_9PEZI|nr:hypothetical protein B0H67DRAFT_551256 [Lasiosphaeris hirsuta]